MVLITRSFFKTGIFPLFFFSLLLWGCGGDEGGEAPTVIRPVKTYTVMGLTEGEYEFPGVVEAGQRLVMSFRVSGRLTELPVKEGESVKKGQLIARLDPTDFAIAVEEARAAFTKAEADFERYRLLYEKDAVPISDLDLRRSQRDIARAKLQNARNNLSYTYLRAPFAGRIGSRYVENFMDVQAQQGIVDLNDITTIDIKIQASENLVAPLKSARDQIEITPLAEFDVAPGNRHPLTFKEVSSRADPATQTFEITFTMPQPKDINLLPGMTALVKLIIKLTESGKIKFQNTTIPAIAVLGDAQGESYVWSLTDDMTVRKMPVKVAEMSGSEDIIVTEGLQGGDQIIIAGMSKLQEGMKVRLWEEQQ